MARETKVGLLAGLAFIICFAVILANRGNEDSLSGLDLPLRHQLTVVDRSQEAESPHSGIVPKSPVGGGGALPYPGVTQLPVGHKEPNPASPQSHEVASQPSPVRMATGKSSREGAVDSAAMMPARTDLPAQNVEGGVALSSALNLNVAPRPVMEQTLDELASRVAPQLRPSASSTGLANQPPLQSGGENLPSAGHAKPKKKYMTVPGDNLSKIAFAQYGSRSASVVNALFEANRSVLPAPDELKAGIELVIPELNASTAAPHPSSILEVGKPEQKTKTEDRRTEPPKFKVKERERETDALARDNGERSYQVRKGDRYYSIARDVLGDGNRWREIYELNKDKFADPEAIREGVRIKLPESRVASGREKRR